MVFNIWVIFLTFYFDFFIISFFCFTIFLSSFYTLDLLIRCSGSLSLYFFLPLSRSNLSLKIS